MIVPMKKITVIVQEKDANSAVSQLRSLGLLHVEHQRVPSGKDFATLGDDMALVDQASGVLSETEFIKAEDKNNKEPSDWRFTARHIIDMRKRIEQLQEYSLKLKNGISQWQPWGDFDPEAIKDLSAKNIYLNLF